MLQQLAQNLCGLYKTYGYQQYSMSKFEDYDLYLQNKDFLISDRILTFTDTDGRLMALKPDVTLSIIKNTQTQQQMLQKICYRENVYRPGKSDQGFREIMQIGLECMGAVDTYSIYEVLLLAVNSLKQICKNCVLDVSHMGLMHRLLENMGLYGTVQKKVLDAISRKNSHELQNICEEANVAPDALVVLARLCGKPADVLPELNGIFGEVPELVQFRQLLTALENAGADCINVDFSVVNDMNYYNGIVFRGFVEGVPTGILSGGQYDGLMEKMGRTGKAIGFALYPDLLERMQTCCQQEADAVLYYEACAPIEDVAAAVSQLKEQGMTVCAQPAGTGTLRCTQRYFLKGNEVRLLENDA